MITFKKILILLLAAVSSFILLLSCDTMSSSSDFEPMTLTGSVTDTQENSLDDVIVRIIDPLPEKVTTTDEAGNFSFELQVDSTTTYTLEVRKEGFNPSELEFLAIVERNINLPKLSLSPVGSSGSDDETLPSSGDESEGSAFITLESLSHNEIQVQETGGIETAEFNFLITDSTGTPVSLANAEDVNFEIASGPGGGESIYPETAKTINGIATTALTSGSAAGAVQVQASFTRDGNTMRSKPINITISGGLPSNNHFEVSTARQNIPSVTSETSEVIVLLGDKHGNTVPEGTSVYFSTNKGTINGSATTDNEGYARSQLKSNNTAPGFATVRVETIDENSTRISREVDILFSGKPQLSASQESINLENFTSQTFSLVLEDENGNPLAEGTQLSAEVDTDELVLSGDVEITLNDNTEAGEGLTEFEFILQNPENHSFYQDSRITIKVEGPNGVITKNIALLASEAPLGTPSSIYLESVTETDLGVQGTGQIESTNLTFTVVDENGNPLTSENSVDVNFRFGNSPDGGEFITESAVTTNSIGQATATVISGSVSGTVQVVAEFTKENGSTVRTSKPVQLVIHAGLPSQSHFTVMPSSNEMQIIAIEYGEQYEFISLVGDKYGNPAPDGTAVYFTTTGGYIQGSAYTENGRASAMLTVANPLPADGAATITASTSDEDELPVTASTGVIFSGDPVITIYPEAFDIGNAADQQFDYTVFDENGNPMMPGTSITVTVEGNEIEILGDVSITVGAPNSSFTNLDELTDYSFIIDDANQEEINDTPVYITIEVEGPNGSARKTITGRKAKIQPR